MMKRQKSGTVRDHVGERVVLIAVKASREISRDALVWALTHVVQPGDCAKLLVVIPAPSSSHKLWKFSKFNSDCTTGQWKTLSGDVKDQKEDITEICSQIMLQLHNIYDSDKIKMKIKVISGTLGGEVAAEAKKTQTQWVVLDRNLKKEAKPCMDELDCNVVVMKKSQPKVLRLNLTGSPTTEPENTTSYPQTPTHHSKQPENTYNTTKVPNVTPVSSPEHSSFTTNDHNTSSLSSQELAFSPFLVTDTKIYTFVDHLDSGSDSENISPSLVQSPTVPATSLCSPWRITDAARVRSKNLTRTSSASETEAVPFSPPKKDDDSDTDYDSGNISPPLVRSPTTSLCSPWRITDTDAARARSKNMTRTASASVTEKSTEIEAVLFSPPKEDDDSDSDSDYHRENVSPSLVQSPATSLHSPWITDAPRVRSGAPVTKKSTETVPVPVPLTRHLVSKSPPLCSSCRNKAPVFGKPPRRFGFRELEEATNGFSGENFLAEGGFGCVHRGVLKDGRMVAVKQHKVASSQGDNEFFSEVDVLSCAQHRNVVKLVGFCVEGGRRLLVYEYVCNGSLDSHLYGRDHGLLEWSARQKIAIGAARGLRYLHEECRVGCIVHRDMRPNNVLLTHDFEALVGDFGLARWQPNGETGVETKIIGTFGYLAPEYAQSGEITEKADVYSFGVVLVELITGRKAVDVNRPKGQQYLTEWARPLLEETAITELIDPRLQDSYSEPEVRCMSLCASLCIRRDPQSRPGMSQVLWMLENDDIK